MVFPAFSTKTGLDLDAFWIPTIKKSYIVAQSLSKNFCIFSLLTCITDEVTWKSNPDY